MYGLDITYVYVTKMSGLLWIQTVWHWWNSWKFVSKVDFFKKNQQATKKIKSPRMQKQNKNKWKNKHKASLDYVSLITKGARHLV